MNISYNKFVKICNENNVYTVLGNGDKCQFRNIGNIQSDITEILKQIHQNSILIYSGNKPDIKHPDIGYIYKLINNYRPDIQILFVTSNKKEYISKNYKFIKYKLFIDKKELKPNTNTVTILNYLNNLITIFKIFIFGGNKDTVKEIKWIKKNKIPYKYFLVERKYKSDGKSLIKNEDELSIKIGETWEILGKHEWAIQTVTDAIKKNIIKLYKTKNNKIKMKFIEK